VPDIAIPGYASAADPESTEPESWAIESAAAVASPMATRRSASVAPHDWPLRGSYPDEDVSNK